MSREVLSAAQCRMARAALQWSLDDAAGATGVSRRTILRLENGQRDIIDEKVHAIRRGFEAAGVRFVTSGDHVGGVVPPLNSPG